MHPSESKFANYLTSYLYIETVRGFDMTNWYSGRSFSLAKSRNAGEAVKCEIRNLHVAPSNINCLAKQTVNNV